MGRKPFCPPDWQRTPAKPRSRGKAACCQGGQKAPKPLSLPRGWAGVLGQSPHPSLTLSLQPPHQLAPVPLWWGGLTQLLGRCGGSHAPGAPATSPRGMGWKPFCPPSWQRTPAPLKGGCLLPAAYPSQAPTVGGKAACCQGGQKAPEPLSLPREGELGRAHMPPPTLSLQPPHQLAPVPLWWGGLAQPLGCCGGGLMPLALQPPP